MGKGAGGQVTLDSGLVWTVFFLQVAGASASSAKGLLTVWTMRVVSSSDIDLLSAVLHCRG